MPMGYNELSLPADIPWKRLAVSSDMLDQTYGDLVFPHKWDTSIAVFYHEPVETDPAYCHRRITYLKVVCTITNYQLGSSDVTILNVLRDKLGPARPFKDFEENATRSYPCHGALLQVGVYPNSSTNVELYDYPYIASMQPRKRELYEVATQSGEIASQSANKLNVMKGGTTTGTTEDYDLDLGGGSGGHSAIFGLWSEQHSGEQKQVGTIQRTQTQNQNVSTTDMSRDRRETYSFSTSINQLHTLLQSYHLGTNRVMFFLQPVPHMQDAKFSFVRGLRRIEGVQEFFLIVNRPAHIKSFCVEIALETAHLYVRRHYMPRLIPIGDLYSPANLAKTEKALGAAVAGNPFFDSYRKMRDAWNLMWAADRWAMSDKTWYPSNDNEAWASEVLVKVPDIGIQDAALIFEEYDVHTGYFFVTGRRFCACWTPKETEEAASAEGGAETEDALHPVDEPCEESSPASLSTCDPSPGSIVFSNKIGSGVLSMDPLKGSLPTAQQHNAMTGALNEALASSLLSADRVAYGRGSFFSTDFMLEELQQLVRNLGDAVPGDLPIRELEAIRRHGTQAAGRAANQTLRELVRSPATAIGREWRIDAPSARKLKMEAILEALRRTDVQRLPAEAEPAAEMDEDLQTRWLRLAESARGTARPPERPADAAPRKRDARPSGGERE